jgi:hypothetical protein
MSAILTRRRFSVGGDGIFAMSGRTGKSASTLGVLPRRLISSTVAACIKSNSPSLKCLTALRRFLGSCGAASVASSAAGNFEGADVFDGVDASRTVAVASDAVRSAGSRPMALACRDRYQSAIGMERPVWAFAYHTA